MSENPPKVPLSVCIVCLNEAHNIADCLGSVSWADDIVVVDSGSQDGTVEIARRYTERVFFRKWEGHIQQKNCALDLAKHEWVLCLDADERVTDELGKEIRGELRRMAAGVARADAFSMPRRVYYLGRWIRWGGWYPDRKVRFFRKSVGRWGGVNPHDHVRVDGKVAPLRCDLLHFTYRNVEDHISRINSYTSIAAKEKKAKGVRGAFLRMLFHPPARFFRMYFLRLGLLDGKAGFVNAVLASCYVFLKYAKLWEMEIEGLSHHREAC